MLVVAKRRFTRKYVIGGAGIFDSITGVFKKLFSSDVARRVASSALSAGKDAAKELGKKALDVGKNTAVEVGKRLMDKTSAKLLASSPRSAETIPTLTRENAAILARLVDNGVDTIPKLTRENAAILARLVEGNVGASNSGTNINKILAGYGLEKPKAVSIRDLVRHRNNSEGAGLKLAR